MLLGVLTLHRHRRGGQRRRRDFLNFIAVIGVKIRESLERLAHVGVTVI